MEPVINAFRIAKNARAALPNVQVVSLVTCYIKEPVYLNVLLAFFAHLTRWNA